MHMHIQRLKGQYDCPVYYLPYDFDLDALILATGHPPGLPAYAGFPVIRASSIRKPQGWGHSGVGLNIPVQTTLKKELFGRRKKFQSDKHPRKSFAR
jgi:hypothetical protein